MPTGVNNYVNKRPLLCRVLLCIMAIEKKTIIVSNRLPVTIVEKDDRIDYKQSEGGLATGLGSIYKQANNVWLGWPGNFIPEERHEEVTQLLKNENLVPVFLTHSEIECFYKGFSNETLWPLFHSFPSYAKYDPLYWQSYKDVNRKYADAIISIAGEQDTIWIHDYQLLLVPQMLRESLPDAEIGFFQHIPFPSQELFRLMPWREEMLKGVLGADLIGFHTYDDVRHFLSAVNRLAKIETNTHEMTVDGRLVMVDAFPISIDYDKYANLANTYQTLRNEAKIKQIANNTRLIISIDRLDYSKGINHRLKAYKLFLEKYPEFHERVTYIHLVVPSRDSVSKYVELKEEMNKLISEINGMYSTLSWQPIRHFYRAFQPAMLSALYKTADVALVTPMRDGMNLVSKEYIASQVEKQGVLMLSETAGAAIELPEALQVNPNDIWGFADKIHEALTMPEEEKQQRMMQMQQTVAKFDINAWVKNFRRKLAEVKEKQMSLLTKSVTETLKNDFYEQYRNSSNRLLLLDYDGTLVPFTKEVNDAVPDPELIALLKELSEQKGTTVVIISGRDYTTLEKWLGDLHVDMVAEHGIWHKNGNRKWQHLMGINSDWKKDIYNIMSLHSDRTTGTFIEEKSYSLAWHYRKAETQLGEVRAQQLVNDLRHFTYENNLQILQGDKVIEVKSAVINKGQASARWLEGSQRDFILAIGDDTTDEDIFRAVPEDAITIKVGEKKSLARYKLKDSNDVRALLKGFCNAYTAANSDKKKLPVL